MKETEKNKREKPHIEKGFGAVAFKFAFIKDGIRYKPVSNVEELDTYSEGFATVVDKHGSHAFMDKNGKLRYDRYFNASPYSEGLAAVMLDVDKCAFVDKNGNLQNGRYEYAFSYSEGFACVKLGNYQWAFIDKSGKLQEGRYMYASSYCEGFACVRLDNYMYAFVDRNSKLQEGRYMYASSYRKRFADVTLYNGIQTKIDKYGNIYLSKREWLHYIKKDPFSYKFIPPHYFNDEKFIGLVDNVVKELYVNRVNKIDSTSSYVMEKFADVTLCDGIQNIVDKYGNIISNTDIGWLDYIIKHPLSYKFIPSHNINDEKFIGLMDNVVKEVYANRVKNIDNTLSYAKGKLAEVRNNFENFCKMRIEKIKTVKEIMQREEQERKEQERLKKRLEQPKEDLIKQINNLDVDKDRG